MADNQFVGIDDAVSDVLHQNTQNTAVQIRNNVQFSLDANPEQEAKYKHLAAATGVPIDTVRAEPEAIKTQAALKQFDADKLAVQFPHTAKFLTDLDNTRMIHDDVENMSDIEGAVKGIVATRDNQEILKAPEGPEASFGSVMAGLGKALPQGTELVRQGMRQQFADLFGFSDMSTDAGRKYAQVQSAVTGSTPEFESRTAAGLYGGGTSLLRQIPGLVASILTRSATPMLAAAGIQTEAESYGKYRARGATPGEAITGASGEGLVEVGTEMIPMGFLVKKLGKVGAGEFIKGFAGRELVTEQLATVLQDAIDTAVANPDKTWGQYIAERPDAAYQTFLATLVQSGAISALHTGMIHVARKAEKAQQAEQSTQFITKLNVLSTASKLLQRDPQSFEQFVATAAEEGPVPQVFIDAKALMQSGLGGELAKVSPSVAAQLDTAIVSGGQIAIPVEEYATRIAPTEYAQGLLDHLKTDSEGFSKAEAQVYMQSHVEELQQEVERTLTEKQGDDTFKQSAAVVKSRILEELNGIGRFNASKNEADATLYAAYYAVRAAQLGVTPEALLDRRQVNFAAEAIGGGRFDQGASGILHQDGYTVGSKDKRDGYTQDLFGNPLPGDGGADTSSSRPAGGSAARAVHRETSGTYATKTELVQENTRTLGAKKIVTPEDAAHATAYLGKGAVERFDAVVTDKNGKPLAVVGAFKGAITQTAVYPATVLAEAFRIPGAANIWFSHNHPSGHAEFSGADRTLYGKLRDAFTGSEITPRGIFAITSVKGGKQRWVFTEDGGSDTKGEITPSGKTAKVPVMERHFTETGTLGEGFSSPSEARVAAEKISNGQSGVMMLNAQNEPIAFIPIHAAETLPLRQDGRMDALYRAVSTANPSSVMIVNHGDYSEDQVRNLAGFFNANDTRALDVFEHNGFGGLDSWASKGYSFSHSTFEQGTEGNRGSFNPDSLTITLLKGADLSTALHEGAHFFFENDIAMAAELQREVNSFGLDSLKPGEQQIINDVSELFKWHGILGDTNSQFSQWYNLSFEEKRAHHERTAESFENYLFEGKAPSLELQPYFQKFRAWLANVYKSIKDFLAKNPEAGKLNDDVRGVFDRMLATTEQIALAEQGRSMMPLFGSPERAGMTPEEFAAYQALGVEASGEAIQELQARGLRDMQWLHNARGRVIKELQKESKAKRREVQMEVRREVMSQPVYRAWAFLTGKISADDKIEAVQLPKSDPNEVDETQDSLFVAIAKLGGLNKDQVIGEWGTDAKDKPASGLFGKPVWRVNGGLTLDGMVEALSQHGYLTLDEHGKANIVELEEKFSEELRGNTQHSNAYEHSNDAETRAGDQVANPQALAAGRFDIAELDAMGLPVEVVNVVKAHRMTAKIGLHPDIVAERFDFASGDELLRTLAASDKPADVIEGMTDQRMLERYGDLSSQQAIEKAADKAIHSDARARMVATEVNALAKATGGRKMLASAAKEFASTMVARLKVRNIKPGQYANAEVRAAKAADKAIKAGDLATAAAEKRNQIINVYATRAAYDAQEQVEDLRRKWSELANRADDKLVKAYDMDLVNAVRAILGEYGIAEKKAKKASEYLATLQNHDPEMYGIVQSSINAAEASAKPFKEMTVEEVRGLADEIDAILHLARRSRQMEIDGDLLDRQDVEDALRERMEEIGIPLTVPGDDHAITKGEERMLKFKTLLAAATRVESWVGKMDGEVPMGPFRRFIWSRIKDSADAYRTDKAKYLKQFRDLFDTIAPTMKPGLISAPELGYTFGKDSGGSAINEIAHAILHTGNESNKRKLLLGRNWAQERADGSIDTSRWDAFIARMAAEGKIDKAHFDFAQGVWNLLDSTKPLAQKTHRDVFGKYFDEVTASPVPTPFGVYAGGYVPAMADSRVVTDAKLRALSEQENAGMAYAFPTTPKGFTKARVEYNRPLMLDLRTLAQHIDKVLLFSHMEMPVRDVQRVLSKVGGTLDRIDPAAIGGMLTPWLNRSARQQVVTPISADGGTSRFLSTLRSRAGAAAMFGNLANAAQQITGFSLAAVKVKPRLLQSAMVDYMRHPRKFAEAVADVSPYMTERLDSEVAAMSDDINAILLNPSLIEQGQAWTMRHAYFLQTAVDSVMSPIVWTAAYNQALERGLDHKDAVRLGDSAVRETQGSTLPEDISRVESGNAFVRLFTQFAGYFNMQANLVGTEFSKLMQAYGLRKGAGRGIYVLMFGFLAPAVVGELVIQLFRGGPDDDDKDGEYLDDWLAALFVWAPLRTATAMIPVGGSVINAAANAWNSKPYDDRMATSPAISMLESAAKAPVSLWNAVANEGSAQKAVRDVATLISMTVGLPANLAARPIGYLSGVADDKINPTGSVDALRGTITGSASPESKH